MGAELHTANEGRGANPRSTCIVDGPLAFRMRRYRAARNGELGLQILTLPLLAARLAGGFVEPARVEDLEPAIRAALDAGGLSELEKIRSLPGMTRAVMRTLNKLWLSDFSLEAACARGPRFRDLAELEKRVRASLGTNMLAPRDLRDAALKRIGHAPAVLGSVVLDKVTEVKPVWRPLIEALSSEVEVAWPIAPHGSDKWFKGHGRLGHRPPQEAQAAVVVSCANPRAEVVEALRWLRELIVSGKAKPGEIAICASTTEAWDDHFLAFGTEAGLPLHFSHGVPALASREGQACASLADILLNGLSQEGVRRLLGYSCGRSPALKALPLSWDEGIQRGAALFELPFWRRALDAAANTKTAYDDPRPVLMPVLELLSQGLKVANRAGELLLDDDARPLWSDALTKAPPSAIAFSLEALRIPDGRDTGSCAVWCPADHLAGAPRPFVRLLGMTSRSWPRRSTEDPLLPNHILPPQEIGLEPFTEHDRKLLELVRSEATGACVMSRSRRDAKGRPLAPSPLLPKGAVTKTLRRTRIPAHAFSASDRIMARPAEMARLPAITAALGCWQNWRRADVTPHDGLVRPEHPAVLATLAEVQSATSLRVLLRDPIRFMWRYALRWQAPAEEDQPLEVDALTFGTLVHELLKRAVDSLEPNPGLGRAADNEIENALRSAAENVRTEWPLRRPVPPSMLWQHVLEEATSLAYRALTLDTNLQAGSRSWTEVEFGREKKADESDPGGLPWPPDAVVKITGTEVSIRGKIDRLDRNTSGWIRVSDYKTGAEPKDADRIVLAGGKELQRVIYALAAKQLIPDNRGVIARLIYLAGETPSARKLPSIDEAISTIAGHVKLAAGSLRRGNALPGEDAAETWNDYRLALPASLDAYLHRKKRALIKTFGDLDQIWRSK